MDGHFWFFLPPVDHPNLIRFFPLTPNLSSPSLATNFLSRRSHGEMQQILYNKDEKRSFKKRIFQISQRQITANPCSIALHLLVLGFATSAASGPRPSQNSEGFALTRSHPAPQPHQPRRNNCAFQRITTAENDRPDGLKH